MVGNYRTGMGKTDVLQVNSFNGVVATGHSSGTVSMWKPTCAAPLVKIQCHKGPITATSFHPNGHLMATASMDEELKIWDLRKFEAIQSLPRHAKSLDFSQKGLLAVSSGSKLQVLGNFSGSHNYSRYMKVAFRPYEDALGIGHSMSLSSIYIPVAGEPNFDSWVANPFETSKQRKEKEVRAILDKLPLESIMLDPTKNGTLKVVRKKEKATIQEREAEMEAAIADAKSVKLKNKMKGKNKPSKQAKKKKEIVKRAERPFLWRNKRKKECLEKRRKKVWRIIINCLYLYKGLFARKLQQHNYG